MFVTYTPEDGDKREWEFRPGSVKASKQALIERKSGMAWDDWVTAVKVRTGPARRTLVWYLLSLEHPHIRWEDVDVSDDEVLVELSVQELLQTREKYLSGAAEADPNASIVLAMIERDIAEARAKFGDGEGKAPSRSAPPLTSG